MAGAGFILGMTHDTPNDFGAAVCRLVRREARLAQTLLSELVTHACL